MWFEQYWALLLLIFIPLYWWFKPNRKALLYSDLSIPLKAQVSRNKTWMKNNYPRILRSLFVACCALGLASPKYGRKPLQQTTLGLDIVMIIDTSGSMRALDLQINDEPVDRLSVVKHVIRQFVEARPSDRIGLVVFGDGAFTQAPLTSDHNILLKLLDYIKIGVIGENTAIGDALGVAVSRLKDIDGKSKIAVLLTDGENTAGAVEPLQAAAAAKQFGVRVYTIGVGREGEVPFPATGIFGGQSIQYVKSHIDEELLKKVSEETGGLFFRAQDTETLQKVYDSIDKLEKAKLNETKSNPALSINHNWLLLGMGFLLLELLLSLSKWRRLP